MVHIKYIYIYNTVLFIQCIQCEHIQQPTCRANATENCSICSWHQCTNMLNITLIASSLGLEVVFEVFEVVLLTLGVLNVLLMVLFIPNPPVPPILCLLALEGIAAAFCCCCAKACCCCNSTVWNSSRNVLQDVVRAVKKALLSSAIYSNTSPEASTFRIVRGITSVCVYRYRGVYSDVYSYSDIDISMEQYKHTHTNIYIQWTELWKY